MKKGIKEKQAEDVGYDDWNDTDWENLCDAMKLLSKISSSTVDHDYHGDMSAEAYDKQPILRFLTLLINRKKFASSANELIKPWKTDRF